MKHFRKLSLLVCACLLLNCLPMKARAQQIPVNDNQATGQLVDAWISVTSMAFPEAAPFLEAGKKLMDMLGVFGQPDATGEALKKINARLDQIEARINRVQDQIDALRNDFFREKNYTRLQLLRTKRELLQGLVVQLQEKPTQADAKRGLVKAVQNIADDFLDPELWSWSDMRRSDGQMLDPDFKPLPTLELYATTLVTWMTAIAYAGGGDDFVKRTYGPALQRHLTYLTAPKSVRANRGDTLATIAANYGLPVGDLAQLNNIENPRQTLQPGTEIRLPDSLSEKIKTRVSARIDQIDKWPKNRVCNYEVFVNDDIRHLVRDVGPGQVQMPSNDVLCQVPEASGHVAREGEMQRAYGIDVMEALSAKLDRLRTQGTLGEQYIGEFDKTSYQQDFIYAINSSGELLWYRHLVVTKPKPQPGDTRKLQTEKQSPDMRRVTTESTGRVGTVTQGSGLGAAGRTRDQGATTTGQGPGRAIERGSQADKISDAGVDVTHLLQGPKLIGSGWEQFRDVVPAGKESIYALTQDGTLKWYRYDNLWDDVGSPQWKGPVTVGSGWQSFAKIVPAGDGILYAIDSNGTLKWYRHSGYVDGAVNWSGPNDVSPTQRSPLGMRYSRSWADFKQVFSGGEGVMYAITSDGVLQWYRHRGYLNGTPDWEGPRNVGTGWQDFTNVFSTGDGNIYALKPTGEVLWYKHVGYKDGSMSWQGPVEIAADWKDFIFVFPRMTGTWTPPVIQ